MRGTLNLQTTMLSSFSTEDLIPPDHPIRRIRAVVDVVLADLDTEFTAMYSEVGRPSIPPEQLLKATILQAMFSVRSVRAFCERLRYDMLFKWFLDLNVDDPAMDASTFSKNQERLLASEIADRFFAAVVKQARLRKYVSSEHFSADGTLLEAWASHKSFRPKKDGDSGPPSSGGRNAEANFRGEKRTNETHESKTDPEAKMAKKGHGTGARLSYMGHTLMENRNALIVDAELTEANGFAERDTAVMMLKRLPRTKKRRTAGFDKGYDAKNFVKECREIGVTPHVAQNTNARRSAVDSRTTRHAGYEVSMRIRKRIEEPFGWLKTVAGGRKLRYIGKKRNRAWFLMSTATYNLLRITVMDAQAA